MCFSLADLRRGVVAEGLREVRLVGEDGLGGLGLGLGLGSALAVFLGLGVFLLRGHGRVDGAFRGTDAGPPTSFLFFATQERQQQDAQRKNGK